MLEMVVLQYDMQEIDSIEHFTVKCHVLNL